MDKIWEKSYQKGINNKLNLKKYKSINDCFDQSVNKYSKKKAFTNFSSDITYKQTKELADNFASYLQNELKLKKGDRLAVMMPNVLQYPVVVFGALSLGIILVNINPLYTPRELEYQLKDSQVETIVIIENFANTLELVIANTQVKSVIIASIGDLLGKIKGIVINFALRKIKKMVPNYNLKGAIRFNDAIKQGRLKSFTKAQVNLGDAAFLQYTGGTTGVSKGAILTHGNICANVLQAVEWTKIEISKKQENEIVVTPLPLYHVFSLTLNLMLFVSLGAQNILITNPRDISSLVKVMKKYKVTVLTGVNTLFNGLVNNEAFKRLNSYNFKIVLGGGAPVQEAIADKWQKITGKVLLEAYGLTECSPGVCVNPMNSKSYQGNIGLPVPLTDIQIRDVNGKELPIGEIGELYVKGPQVMKGYWNNEKETNKVLKEGWLATGDMAIVNEKGFVKIVDRKKDIVIVSGFNVYPNEIEDVVAMHPKVQEVACIGVPNAKTGESLKIFVVKRDEDLTTNEIIKFCRKHLISYKVPRRIEFRDELPKSNIGKILRKFLKEEK